MVVKIINSLQILLFEFSSFRSKAWAVTGRGFIAIRSTGLVGTSSVHVELCPFIFFTF